MKTKLIFTASLLVLLVLAGAVNAGASQTVAPLQDGGLMFVENIGQFDPQVRFQAQGDNGALWVTNGGLWVAMIEPASEGAEAAHGVALKLSFEGANPQPAIAPFDRLETEMSYFLGDSPAQWVTNAPVWAGVRYVDLYPGIDLELSGQAGQLAPKLVVHDPTALDQVRLHVEGGEATNASAGPMIVETALGPVALPLLAAEGASDLAHPAILALGDGAFLVTTPFAAASGEEQVEEVMASEATTAVVTTLTFSTYLGGSSIDFGTSIDSDSAGNIYVCGGTDSTNFPATAGAFDTSHNGGRDAFIAKYDAAGNLVRSTFVGGSGGGGPEFCGALAVKASTGDVYFAGGTNSANFPVTAGAFDTSYNGGSNSYACKLNSALDSLVYCTYLGTGVAWALAIDANDNAYIGGSAYSGFPTTPGTAQPVFSGGRDGFVARLNASGSGLVWATYLGGSGGEDVQGITVAGANSFAVGFTDSANFPTTTNAYDGIHNGGGNDGFITKLNSSGGFVYSTFVGSSSKDDLYGVAVDNQNQVYVCGISSSTGYPTTANAFQAIPQGQDVVVTVLNAAGNALVYSSFFGGGGSEVCSDIALDNANNALIAGTTNSGNLPTQDPYQASKSGGDDAFLAKLSTTSSSLLYGTYLGGGSNDRADDINVNGAGHILVVGTTQSGNFPTMNAADSSFNGSEDVFITKLSMDSPLDSDGDGILDIDDNCPTTPNTDQADLDADGLGDVCDPDKDNDGVLDATDNCPVTPNPDQADLDSDGLGDVCDPDIDSDGVLNATDNCPVTPNPDQADLDSDGLGDVCDPDIDGDGVLDATDNCPVTPNPDQADLDSDGIGDVCDPDIDGDGVTNITDNCPALANPDQVDLDADGIGDACDPDVRVAPVVGAIGVTPEPPLIAVNGTVQATASFVDPTPTDVHVAQWTWGDGAVTNSALPVGERGATANHTYTLPGVYTITLVVTDDDGLAGTSLYTYVVVYNPDGGFVTGGGWIQSPPGACRYGDCTEATMGKATFGFTAKYKKGANTPEGNTQFQFKAGNLNFHSNSYEWLVVAGANAKFKGVGTINGAGNFGFMITATDGQLPGGGGVDGFRIKIWNKDTGDGVVYDNHMGANDDSNETTVLGGGSIVIHKD